MSTAISISLLKSPYLVSKSVGINYQNFSAEIIITERNFSAKQSQSKEKIFLTTLWALHHKISKADL